MSKPKSFDSWPPEKQEEWRKMLNEKARASYLKRMQDPQKRKRKRELAKEWAKENPAKMKIYEETYRARHPEKIKERAEKRRIENKAQLYESCKKWRKKNPEKWAAIKKRDRVANKERANKASKKWRKENPERFRALAEKWKTENPVKWKLCQERAQAKYRSKRKQQEAADNFFLMAGAVEEIKRHTTHKKER